MSEKPKHPGGRPTKKNSVDWKAVEILLKEGYTDVQICGIFHISEPTLTAWKKNDKEFLTSLKSWKEGADEKVEVSLYERACGYSHPDSDIKVINGKIVVTEIIKHYPPDPTAMIFWLKNRQPARWRDKQEIQHSGTVGVKTIEIVPASKGKGDEQAQEG